MRQYCFRTQANEGRLPNPQAPKPPLFLSGRAHGRKRRYSAIQYVSGLVNETFQPML